MWKWEQNQYDKPKLLIFSMHLSKFSIFALWQNNFWHFFTDKDPFDGQYTKFRITILLYVEFMCLKNCQKSKNQKNAWKKSIILACQTDFALISTHFVRWGYNFTWITTVKVPFLHNLLTNIVKCLEILVFLLWV